MNYRNNTIKAAILKWIAAMCYIYNWTLVHAEELGPNSGATVATSLVCPNEASNASGNLIMEYSSPQDGSSARMTVTYLDNYPTILRLDIAGSDHVWNTVTKRDTNNESDPKRIALFKKVTRITDPIFNQVCLGSREAKAKFAAKLQANKASIPDSKNP